MPISMVFSNPVFFFSWILAILWALTIHEFSHGLSAKLLGDYTAEASGRLTLNPLAHIDFLGFMLLLFAGFGWGKPVPVNFLNLKNKKYGPAIVALSGPFSNFLSMLFFAGVYKTLKLIGITSQFFHQFFMIFLLINGVLMAFNLIPIPPLDGSKILFAFLPQTYKMEEIKTKLEIQGPFILLFIILIDRISNAGILNLLFSGIFKLTFLLLS